MFIKKEDLKNIIREVVKDEITKAFTYDITQQQVDNETGKVLDSRVLKDTNIILYLLEALSNYESHNRVLTTSICESNNQIGTLKKGMESISSILIQTSESLKIIEKYSKKIKEIENQNLIEHKGD